MNSVPLRDLTRIKLRALVLVLSLGTTFAHEVPRPQEGTSQAVDPSPIEKLRLTLTSSKPSYVLYEPVTLRWTVSNPTDADARITAGLDFRTGGVSIRITDPNGIDHRFWTGPLASTVVDEWTLRAGSEAGAGITFLMNDHEHVLAFPMVGMYSIRASLGIAGGRELAELEAPVLGLDIVEPLADDLLFLDRMGSRERWLAIFRLSPEEYCRDKPMSLCVSTLRSTVRGAPTSAYAPHLLHLMGGFAAAGLLGGSSNKGMAIEMYNEFLALWPTHELRRNIYVHMAWMLAEVGRHPEARLFLSRLESEFPDSQMDVASLRQHLEARRRR